MFGVYALVVQAEALIFGAMMIFQINIKSLKEEKTESIFEYINNNPGCIISDISKKLFFSSGAIRHYIIKLEDNGKIVQRKIGKFNRLFSRSPAHTEMEKLIFSLISNNKNRSLLISIIDNDGITNQELSKKLIMEKSDIHRRIKVLLNNKIIISKKKGRFKYYYLNYEYFDMILKLINSSD